jgi:hypothetical protein
MHMLTHTGDRSFECPICKQKFARITCVRYHCKHVHKDVDPINWQVELEQRKREKEEKRKEQEALRRAREGPKKKTTKKKGAKDNAKAQHLQCNFFCWRVLKVT